MTEVILSSWLYCLCEHYFFFKETTVYETVFDGEAIDPGMMLLYFFELNTVCGFRNSKI